jgi:hypothetical protein
MIGSIRTAVVISALGISPLASADSSEAGWESVTLSRGACYGQCPIYDVTIRADGRVVFNGEKFVKLVGKQESRLPLQDIALLTAVIRRVGIDTMRDQYFSKADGCVKVATDFPSMSLSVTVAGKKKSVAIDVSCQGPNVPFAKLTWLAKTIDFMANTEILIGDRE